MSSLESRGANYIEVDIANEQEIPDMDEKPTICVKEDRADYMFVNFSKKAPTKQKNQNNYMEYSLDLKVSPSS